MKVYVLIMNYAYGNIKDVARVGVYDTKEKAQKAMEEEIDATKKKWTEHWDADAAKLLKISKGDETGVIAHSDMYKYFTITEKETKKN